MIAFLSSFKKLTHIAAIAGSAAVAWAVSDQGQSVIGGFVHAYPHLSGIVTVIGMVAALYHSPKS